MSRSWADTYLLGIAADGIALHGPEGQEILCPANTPAAGLTALAQVALPPRRSLLRPRLRVTVADTLARHWLVQPPANARNLRTLQTVAQARFEQLYGEPATAWRIAADWSSRRAFLASALPASLCAAVAQLAQQQGWQLCDLQPGLVRAWNRHAPQLPSSLWFCLAEEDALSYAVIQRGLWLSTRQLRFAALPSTTELQDRLTSEARKLGLHHPDLPTVMRWAGNASWLPKTTRFGDWESAPLLANQADKPQSPAQGLALQGSPA